MLASISMLFELGLRRQHTAVFRTLEIWDNNRQSDRALGHLARCWRSPALSTFEGMGLAGHGERAPFDCGRLASRP
jgi:hypothetical protein